MRQHGYYTVEAALIMPFVTLIFAALLYVVMMIHDRCMIKMWADRFAEQGSYLILENEKRNSDQSEEAVLNALKVQEIEKLVNGLLVTDDIRVDLTCSNYLTGHMMETQCVISGVIRVPQLFQVFIPNDTISESGLCRLIHAKRWIYSNDALTGGR